MGLRAVFFVFAQLQSFGCDHKRVYGIYRELRPYLRIKPRYRLKWARGGQASVSGASKPNVAVKLYGISNEGKAHVPDILHAR